MTSLETSGSGSFESQFASELRGVVDTYRGRCLWFLRADYYPETPEEIVRVLRQIEAHGDRTAFQRAAGLRKWLSQNSSARSAGS